MFCKERLTPGSSKPEHNTASLGYVYSGLYMGMEANLMGGTNPDGSFDFFEGLIPASEAEPDGGNVANHR